MLETVKPKQGLSRHQNSKNRKTQLKQGDVSTSTIAENPLNPVYSKDYINIMCKTANYWSLLLRWDHFCIQVLWMFPGLRSLPI